MTALAQLHAKAVLWSRLLYLVGVAALVACGAVASTSGPTGLIPRPSLTGNCSMTGNGGWLEASASGKVVVFGKNVTETGSCGYTIGGTVTGIPMSVTVEALCRYVGYLNDAGAGYCNDLGDTIANRILARDLLSGGTTESRTSYTWRIKPGAPSLALAEKAFTHRPGNLGRLEFRDYVEVTFPRSSNLAYLAKGTATLEGAKVGAVFGLSGPPEVVIGQYRSWEVGTGGYAPDLFRCRWTWDTQPIGTTALNALTSGVPSGVPSGPGPHTLAIHPNSPSMRRLITLC